MDPTTRHRLGSEFGRAAQTYAANRPSYPPACVAWLAGERPARVLDLGAGTGALTRALVEADHLVTAAEPSEAMAAALASALPDTAAVRARAESLPFAAGSFDRVTVATAFHWFDPGPALREIAHVLSPGGWLALVWATRDERAGWPRRLGDLLRGAQPPGLRGDWGAGSAVELQASPLFGAAEHEEFAFTQTLDRSAFLGLIASRSYVIALDDAARSNLMAAAGALFDREATGGRLGIPYRSQCWRAPLLA